MGTFGRGERQMHCHAFCGVFSDLEVYFGEHEKSRNAKEMWANLLVAEVELGVALGLPLPQH